jgi:hypothetical protein
MEIFTCFGMWNSRQKFVRTSQSHSVYAERIPIEILNSLQLLGERISGKYSLNTILISVFMKTRHYLPASSDILYLKYRC